MGGFTLDLSWKDGVLDEAVIHPGFKASCKVRYGDQVTSIATDSGAVTLNANSFKKR